MGWKTRVGVVALGALGYPGYQDEGIKREVVSLVENAIGTKEATRTGRKE